MNIFYYIWGWLFPACTKATRREVYRQMHLISLSFIDKGRGYNVNFCYTLPRCIKAGMSEKLWKYPELYKYKPFIKRFDSSDAYAWFSMDKEGCQKRIEILEKISK